MPDCAPLISWIGYDKKIIEFEFGTDVTGLGSWAFFNRVSITSITIPSDITNIASDTFNYASGLRNVIFQGKTISQIQAMSNYPFGLNKTQSGTITTVHCTDGEIQIQ